MGHPALSLFCVVVRVIFLTFSSGNVIFLIKILSWFLCALKCEPLVPCLVQLYTLLLPSSVQLAVILPRCCAFSCLHPQGLAVPSFWKMSSPRQSSLSARHTVIHPLELGSYSPQLTLTELESSSSPLALPLACYNQCPIIL